jgi:formylglycine-generating enzyme required for sulfatase activity
MIKMRLALTIYILVGFLTFSGCTKDSAEMPLLEIEMIKVLEGLFLMGSDKGYALNETPRRSVNLSAFLMSRYEVTEYQYLTAIGEPLRFVNCGNCPVEQVSWHDAIRFCNKLSVSEGLVPAYIIATDTVIWNRNADGYRLPTEAEWEYACKAGTDTDYYTGDMLGFDFMSMDSVLHKAGWYLLNSNNRPEPAGQKQANAFGLFDMHGNVWEWCWDYFDEERYLRMEGSSYNPVDETFAPERVTRGGSYFNNAFNARSALRYFAQPHDQIRAVGFRVVRNY